MYNLITVAEHSILDTGKFERVIDVGCRDLDFARYFLELGAEVVSLDPTYEVNNLTYPKLYHNKTALIADKTKSVLFCAFGNGTGDFVCSAARPPVLGGQVYEVPTINLVELLKKYQWEWVDVLKLDCEGSEYDILLNIQKPVFKQISVEFHDFLGINPSHPDCEFYHEQLFQHLSKWYRRINYVKTLANGILVPNYWDTLFVLKDL